MASFFTKVSSQGQVSLPAEVRRALAVEQGSTLEWTVENDVVRVERHKVYTFADMHRVLFPEGPPPYASEEEWDAAKAEYLMEKHGGRRGGR